MDDDVDLSVKGGTLCPREHKIGEKPKDVLNL